MNDPLTKIMSKNSHLTEKQLETLLIDILAEEVVEKDLGYEEKSKMRLNRSEVSRGSFNRTLKQARRNVVRSIYTILLLGYLGILETPKLSYYLEISNRLESYMKAYQRLLEMPNSSTDEERNRTITTITEDLKLTLSELSQFKNTP